MLTPQASSHSQVAALSSLGAELDRNLAQDTIVLENEEESSLFVP